MYVYIQDLYKDIIFSSERVLTKGEVQERLELRQDLWSWTLVLWCVWKASNSDGSCLSCWNLEQVLIQEEP